MPRTLGEEQGERHQRLSFHYKSFQQPEVDALKIFLWHGGRKWLDAEEQAATVNFHKKEFQTARLCTVGTSFTRSRQNVSSICFNCVILFKDLIWYGSEIFVIDASTVIASETRHSLNKQGWKHHLEHIGLPITSTCVIETSIFKCPIIKAAMNQVHWNQTMFETLFAEDKCSDKCCGNSLKKQWKQDFTVNLKVAPTTNASQAKFMPWWPRKLF